MEESISAVKSVRAFQSRGAKALSSQKSNKEASVPRDGLKSALRSKENLTAARDERSAGGQVSRAAGGVIPDDKKRGRPNRATRLSGRTGSAESSRADGADPPHPLGSPESRTAVPAGGCRDAVLPVKSATPERRLPEQDEPHGETL